MRQTVDEVGRAVDWIHNPACRGFFWAKKTAFFADKCVLRIGFEQAFAQDLLHVLVDFRHQVLQTFLADFDLIQIQRGAVDHQSGGACGVYRGFEHRLHCFSNLYYFQGASHAGRKIRVCIPVVHLTAMRERLKMATALFYCIFEVS